MPPAAAILGCAGPELTHAERRLFAAADPVGFILFARNVVDSGQLGRLVRDLRDSVGRPDALVLIDQEGGPVMRLRPPHWPPRAAAEALGRSHHPQRAAWLQGRLIAADLAAVGISVDCAPVADLAFAGAHPVIGNRAFGRDPDAVAEGAEAFAQGLLAGGVLPVVKHLPGHGRAVVDSHLATPRVAASHAELAEQDFRAFRRLQRLPIGMTAHVVYEALDPVPATLSRVIVGDIIRGEIGFSGLLLTDDLSMAALDGGFDRRAAAARDAGCDIVLHCNGNPGEMAGVIEGAGRLDHAGTCRLADALARIAEPAAGPALPAGLDGLEAELGRLLPGQPEVALSAVTVTPT